MDHMDHSPQAVAHAGQTAVPAGVGAAAWDGRLPDWPSGGHTLEVGAGKAYSNLEAALAVAGDGDRVIVFGGLSKGTFHVKQRVWLEGRDEAVLDGGGQGSVVTVEAPGARVTGFMIHNTGESLNLEDSGVYLQDARGAVVAGCHLMNVEFGIVAKSSPEVLVAGNTVIGKGRDLSLSGDGIRIFFSKNARVLANTVQQTRELLVEQTEGVEIRANAVIDGRQGIHLMRAPQATIVENFLGGNSTGVYVMYGDGTQVLRNWMQENRGPSGYGVGVKEASGVRVEGNWLVGNRAAIYLDSAPLDPAIPGTEIGNFVAYNDVGILLTTATQGNQISGNDFVENLQQVGLSAEGKPGANRWTVAGRGNYWSDYNGYDADGDRVGEVPYAPVNVFEGWMDRQPDLRWFWFTPASAAVDAGAQAFPLAAADPVLVDERPAMAPAKRGERPWSSYSK
jgi:nitrous oxidase accessory protein